MAKIYSIAAPDGYTYDIEGPDDANEHSLFEMARRASQERQLADLNKVEPERTFGGHAKELLKGIPAGALGLVETAGTGIAALLPEETEKSFRQGMKENLAGAKEYLAAAPGYEDAMSRKFSEGLGSTIPFALAGPLGWAGRAASVGVGAAAGAGEARERAEATGATADERAKATAMGIAPGLLDFLPFAAAEKAVGRIRRAMIAGGYEGATEAAQQIAQNAIAKSVYDPEAALLEGSGEAAGYGGAVGAFAQALIDAALHRKGPKGKTPPPEEMKALPAPPPALPAPEGPAGEGIESIFGVKPSAESGATPMPEGGREAMGETPELSAAMEGAGTVPMPEKGPTVERAPAASVEEAFGFPREVSLEEGVRDTTSRREPETVEGAPVFPKLASPYIEGEVVPERAALPETRALTGPETATPQLSQTRALPAPEEGAAQAPAATAQPTATGTPQLPGLDTPMQVFRAVKKGYKGGDTIKDGVYITASEQTAREFAGADGTVTPLQTTPEALRTGATPVAPDITPQVLDALGIPPNAPVRKRIKGKPQAAPEVQSELAAIAQNPNVAPEVQQNIDSFLTTGTIASPVTAPKETPSAVTRTEPAGAGVSPEGVVRERGQRRAAVPSTERTEAPKATRLGDTKRVPDVVGRGKGTAQPTIAEEIAAAAEELEKKAPKKEAKAEPTSKKEKPSRKPKNARKLPPNKAGEKPMDFATVMREGYTNYAKEDVGEKLDRENVASLVNSTGGDAKKQAARKYFSKMRRLVDNLLNISYDFVFPSERFRPTGERMDERAFFSGMNTNNAINAVQWVQKNLSPAVNKKLSEFINMWQNEAAMIDKNIESIMAAHTQGFVTIRTDAKTTELTDSDWAFFEEWANTTGKGIKALDAVSRNTFALHPMVQSMLRAGDLRMALKYFAATTDGMASRIASKIASAMGDTKVEVIDNLQDETGRNVPGLFDPQTNTIYLDSKTGMTGHALTHEVVHALTSHVLSNPHHPVTKQLQKIYDAVKDQLSSYYGSQSLDEFVAEAFGNPDFRSELNMLSPDGKPVSAWARFVNAIKNFIRRMVGLEPSEVNAASEVDQLVTSILSAAPTNRNAESLYMMSAAGTANQFFADWGKQIDSMPVWNNNMAVRVRTFLTERVPYALKEFYLKLLPLHALVDVCGTAIPSAKRINNLVRERFAYENQLQNELRTTIRELEQWAATQSDEKMKNLFTAANESTLAKVDITLTRQQLIDKMTKAKADKSDIKDALEAYDRIRPFYDKIGADGQKVYKIVRDSYKKLYDEIKGTIIQRLKDTGADEKNANKITNEIYAKLIETAGAIDPYFALGRPQGEFRVAYNMKNDVTGAPERYVHHFKSDFERRQFIRELEQHLRDTNQKVEDSDIQAFHAKDDFDYRNAPPTSFVRSVLNVLQTNKMTRKVTKNGVTVEEEIKIDDQASQEILRIFVDLLPETSFVKGFKKRKGIRGFEENIIKTLHDKGHALARQLANMKYGAKLSAARDEIDQDIKGKNDQTTAMLAKALKEHTRFAINPRLPYWSKVMRSFGFAMTLGFNVSSAIINMTQIPLIVFPQLASRYGVKEATKMIGQAVKLYAGSGFTHKTKAFVETLKGGSYRDVKAAPSLDNYFSGFKRDENGEISAKDLASLPKEVQRLYPLWKMADRFGELSRSQTQETLDADDYDTRLSKLNSFQGFMMHVTERMNRQITMLAAYELELQKLEKEGKLTPEAMNKAAEQALFVTELTNGGIAAAAAPRIAHTGVGAVAFMYKRFGVTMYYLLGRTLHAALKDADPKVRKEAITQLGMTYGTAAIFSGIRGLPLFGVFAMIYNMFKDDDDDDLETVTRKAFPWWASRGLMNTITGLETGSRTGLSDLIFRDPMNSKDLPVTAQALEMFGGPLVGIANRWERGISQINDGHVLRGLEQMMPSSVGNGMKAIRYGTEGTQTLRGDPITGEVNPYNVFAQAFGFAPAEYTRQLEENAAKKGYEKATLEKKGKLLDKYWMAYKNGDAEGVADISEEMAKFNEKHPSIPITGLTIQHSLAQHVRSKATTQHGITFNKKLLGELNSRFADYDADVTDE